MTKKKEDAALHIMSKPTQSALARLQSHHSQLKSAANSPKPNMTTIRKLISGMPEIISKLVTEVQLCKEETEALEEQSDGPYPTKMNIKAPGERQATRMVNAFCAEIIALKGQLAQLENGTRSGEADYQVVACNAGDVNTLQSKLGKIERSLDSLISKMRAGIDRLQQELILSQQRFESSRANTMDGVLRVEIAGLKAQLGDLREKIPAAKYAREQERLENDGSTLTESLAELAAQHDDGFVAFQSDANADDSDGGDSDDTRVLITSKPISGPEKPGRRRKRQGTLLGAQDEQASKKTKTCHADNNAAPTATDTICVPCFVLGRFDCDRQGPCNNCLGPEECSYDCALGKDCDLAGCQYNHEDGFRAPGPQQLDDVLGTGLDHAEEAPNTIDEDQMHPDRLSMLGQGTDRVPRKKHTAVEGLGVTSGAVKRIHADPDPAVPQYEASNTVFVGNLPFSTTTADDLQNLFKGYYIRSIDYEGFGRQPARRRLGHAFVEVATELEAMRAVRELHG